MKLALCAKGDKIRSYVPKYLKTMNGVVGGRTRTRVHVARENGIGYSLPKDSDVERMPRQ